MTNPRFPHSVVIKRLSGGDPFTAPTEETLYSGVCRTERFEKRNLRSGVMESDYRMSIPHYTIPSGKAPTAGDKLTVTTSAYTLSGEVVDFEWNNLGITLWWNRSNN